MALAGAPPCSVERIAIGSTLWRSLAAKLCWPRRLGSTTDASIVAPLSYSTHILRINSTYGICTPYRRRRTPESLHSCCMIMRFDRPIITRVVSRPYTAINPCCSYTYIVLWTGNRVSELTDTLFPLNLICTQGYIYYTCDMGTILIHT